jgi:A/G-specific adenine glycosylase
MAEREPLQPSWVRAVRRGVLAFFVERRRNLPWRRSADPYRVWVSEIMLQQTRVETVVPYYERWLERFPTVDALAAASTDDVLHAWQGLGYYSRARNLHRAAGVVRERWRGQVPDTTETLRALPGVGAYTAGAIASIAYGRRVPAVDGNVRRVLSRLADRDFTAAALQDLAAALVPADRPGDFNQALMELGATVCTPRNPACAACPVARQCRARERGTVLERPAKRRAAPVPSFQVGTAVARDAHGRWVLARRPDRGLLAGLWQFPGVIVRPGETVRHAAARALHELGLNVSARTRDPLAIVAHAFSHRREVYHAFGFTLADEGVATSDRLVCVACDELPALALPAAQRRIAALALAAATPRRPRVSGPSDASGPRPRGRAPRKTGSRPAQPGRKRADRP